MVIQLGAGDGTISTDTEVENQSETETEDESPDESEDEPEEQPSPRLDGGRRGVIDRPVGPVRRNLVHEFELQPPGEVRPPPMNVGGYNQGVRGPVLQRSQQLQQPQQPPIPRPRVFPPRFPVQQQQIQQPQPNQQPQLRPQLQPPPEPNQPRPELQPNGRLRPVREQMEELLG